MFTNIPSATLRKLVKLSERKEALMVQIQEIDREMTRLARQVDQTPGALSHKGRVTFSAAPKKRLGRRRLKRGALKKKLSKRCARPERRE